MDKKEANNLIDEYILSGKREEAVRIVMEYYSISFVEASEKVDAYLPKLIRRKQITSNTNKGIFAGLGIVIIILSSFIFFLLAGIFYVCYIFIVALAH